MVCSMLVCVSLSINVCMFTVSNALLMSNATAMVRVGRMAWLKPVATVLLMLCSAVLVECLVLNPCCVVMFGMLCVSLDLCICFCQLCIVFACILFIQHIYVWYSIV